MKTIGTVKIKDIKNLSDYILNKDSDISNEIKKLNDIFSKLSNDDRRELNVLNYLWDKSWNKRYVEDLNKAWEYCEIYNQKMDLCFKDDTHVVVRFPDGKNFALLPIWAVRTEYFVDYSETPISELRLTGSGLDVTNALALLDNETLNSKKSSIEKKKEEIELAKEKIRKMEEDKKTELEHLKMELEAKFAGKLKILDEKKAELEIMKQKLEGELFLLDTEIYGIRCFFGETVKFTKLISGKNEEDKEPVVLYQKIRYLDEELSKAVAIYDISGEDEDCILFEELIKEREDIRNLFFPEGKSLSLVRISADGRVYASKQNNTANNSGTVFVSNVMKEYEVYHGTKIAILVRNGDNCYIGWTDVDRINIPDGNAFYSPKKETESLEEDNKNMKSSSKDEIASRYFIFSILQGLVLNSKIINLPDGEDIIHRNQEYVIYSMADNWITDTRFGDFKDIMERTKGVIKKGDFVLTMQSLSAEGNKFRTYNNDRGRGYNNRTHDVYADDFTIYPINLVEVEETKIVRYESRNSWEKDKWNSVYSCGSLDNINLDMERVRNAYDDILREYKFYISLEKDVNWRRFSDFHARANFQLYENEFLNLTFLNSLFLRYIILNKKIGEWRVNGREVNFSYLLPYLNKALEYLAKRENEEAKLISKYIEIDKIDDWQVELSDWKVKYDVHSITDYQAKRFAKYLLT